MSKFDKLWKYVSEIGSNILNLTYAEIEIIAGIPIDHSFLMYIKN